MHLPVEGLRVNCHHTDSCKSDLPAQAALHLHRGSPEGILSDVWSGARGPFSEATLPARKVDRHICKWWKVFAHLSFKGTFFILLQWLFIKTLHSSVGNPSSAITCLLRVRFAPICLTAKSPHLQWEWHVLVRGRIWLFQM